MRFVSTRGRAAPRSLSEALRGGAAPDGGLYMPEEVPQVRLDDLDARLGLPNFAALLLRPFFQGDALESELPAICEEAFDFPIPIALDGQRPTLNLLELFHGPTGAFKDFGARFLMACFDRLGEPLTVLAATSGDTGGAVGCAANGRLNVRAAILYPRGRVSPFQKRQLTCWGSNVQAIEVNGDFDDCQRLVKSAFGDERLVRDHRLTSANSINIGRVLPQLAYSAWAAVRVRAVTSEVPGFVIPTGNLGHGLAVLLARAMGLPVGPVVLATNANRTLKEWSRSGRFEPRASVPTLANAMDVGNPSNFERLACLPEKLRDVRVELVTDDEIEDRIVWEYREKGRVLCPHSATAVEAWSRLPDRGERPWIIAATAHPYKFSEVVEPLIGRKLDGGELLASIAGAHGRKLQIPPALDALADALHGRASGGHPSLVGMPRAAARSAALGQV